MEPGHQQYSGWFTLEEIRALAAGTVPDSVRETMREAVAILDGAMSPTEVRKPKRAQKETAA